MPAYATAVVVGLLLALAAPLGAMAKSDKGPQVKIEDKGDKYKYEYKDANCKFKYEYRYDRGEEKFEEKGNCGNLARLPQFNPPRALGLERRGEPGRVYRKDLTAYCNSAELGAALGAASGAALGNGQGDLLATLLGSVIGAAIANEIGDDDRRCIGSTLEYVEPGRRLHFDNARNGLAYSLQPLDRFARSGRECRRFEIRFDGRSSRDGIACRNGDRRWELVELR